MKSFYAIAVVFVMLLSLCGCSSVESEGIMPTSEVVSTVDDNMEEGLGNNFVSQSLNDEELSCTRRISPIESRGRAW